MYALAWTPNFCGERFTLETFADHDGVTKRLTEIHKAKYEDVKWNLYVSLSDDPTGQPDLKLIDSYHNNLSMMEIWIEPKWYGGRDYGEEQIKNARLGKILMKYIDRLNDPVEDAGDGSYYDSLQGIVEELSFDVDKEIEWQRK